MCYSCAVVFDAPGQSLRVKMLLLSTYMPGSEGRGVLRWRLLRMYVLVCDPLSMQSTKGGPRHTVIPALLNTLLLRHTCGVTVYGLKIETTRCYVRTCSYISDALSVQSTKLCRSHHCWDCQICCHSIRLESSRQLTLTWLPNKVRHYLLVSYHDNLTTLLLDVGGDQQTLGGRSRRARLVHSRRGEESLCVASGSSIYAVGFCRGRARTDYKQ